MPTLYYGPVLTESAWLFRDSSGSTSVPNPGHSGPKSWPENTPFRFIKAGSVKSVAAENRDDEKRDDNAHYLVGLWNGSLACRNLDARCEISQIHGTKPPLV